MRHQRAGLHLSRTSAHRKALFSNLVASLFTYERIRTTDAKAKQTRRLAERTITWARRLGDVLTKSPEKRNEEERARVVHAVRMARRVVRDRGAVVKLFEEIGPRYLGRHGGYTRIVKIGQRPGDAAPMSLLELIPDDGPARPAAAPDEGGAEDAGTGKAKKAAAEGDQGEKSAKAKAKAEKAPAAKAKARAAAAPAKSKTKAPAEKKAPAKKAGKPSSKKGK
jgi:large subunit ribosomal protein L17